MRKHAIIVAAAAALLSAAQSPAQTKQETKLYKKTIKASSRASYEKFLSKMPRSFYADEIRARLDTLLSISPYSITEAGEIARSVLGGTGPLFAFPQREDAEDRIAVLILDGEGGCRFLPLSKSGDGWKAGPEMAFTPDADAPQVLVFTDEGKSVQVGGKGMMQCGALYRMACEGNGTDIQMRYSRWLLDAFSENLPQVDFFGADILGEVDSLPFKIEGRINDMGIDPKDSGAAWLKASFASDPRLVELPFEVVQSDEAIRWWRKENAATAKTGGTLKFCSLPQECSLISEFARSKYKSRSSKYIAALFDYRGWTVIVSQNRETGAYNLAWAEPECKDHARDILLNGITFRSTTSLEMQYYHGRKFYKKSLNLSSMNFK